MDPYPGVQFHHSPIDIVDTIHFCYIPTDIHTLTASIINNAPQYGCKLRQAPITPYYQSDDGLVAVMLPIVCQGAQKVGVSRQTKIPCPKKWGLS
jgi:hypothetical protein